MRKTIGDRIERLKAERDERIHALRAQGLTCQQIAERVGLTRQRVAQLLGKGSRPKREGRRASEAQVASS